MCCGSWGCKESDMTELNERQINTAQMKEQTGNTKVQINAEEIGKPSEKSIQNNDSKADRNP